jgi:pimeloyl-ACP methyl ester carboxylesterase
LLSSLKELCIMSISGFALVIAAMLALSVTSNEARAAEPNCPTIPDTSLWPDPQAGIAPQPPGQIKDMTREHVPNDAQPGAGYCMYSPKDTSQAIYGLIMYLHGYPPLGVEPGSYDPMLQYLAKSGFYVIYPYAPSHSDQLKYPSLARAALTNALARLSQQNITITKVAVVGHSHGGAAAIRVAATWMAAPPISALILHDTSGHACPDRSDQEDPQAQQCRQEWDFSFTALERIPCSTYLLIVGAEMSVHGGSSMMFWKDLRHIARYAGTSGTTAKRNYLLVRSDMSHMVHLPPIRLDSTHLTPIVLHPVTCALSTLLSGRRDDYGCYLTSMDYYGYWEPTRAAIHQAFGGQMPDDYTPYCSSDSMSGVCTKTRDMGIWQTDGIPATPMMNAADMRLNQTYPDYCSR